MHKQTSFIYNGTRLRKNMLFSCITYCIDVVKHPYKNMSRVLTKKSIRRIPTLRRFVTLMEYTHTPCAFSRQLFAYYRSILMITLSRMTNLMSSMQYKYQSLHVNFRGMRLLPHMSVYIGNKVVNTDCIMR